MKSHWRFESQGHWAGSHVFLWLGDKPREARKPVEDLTMFEDQQELMMFGLNFTVSESKHSISWSGWGLTHDWIIGSNDAWFDALKSGKFRMAGDDGYILIHPTNLRPSFRP